MYSADDGMLTEFHFAHHAQFALRGPGAIFIEATAVTPEGRISPQVCCSCVCENSLWVTAISNQFNQNKQAGLLNQL
jgi:2,4-dienoyl-CoA reductase-like NADH-dependent reductase (Old Yellow Enzyme family)